MLETIMIVVLKLLSPVNKLDDAGERVLQFRAKHLCAVSQPIKNVKNRRLILCLIWV